ncbi:MAG TPA: hypothetical protein DET40_07415 [Lentisphaeria bacterium]|nr:MAG: hypothetical protein A2X45_06885 [Lentisphaerae bacterium GWF2_50_93]HCE43360.1 hypothetical protein [Lentisphaeria bacterium]
MDLKSKHLIYLKGFLFLALGTAGTAIIIALHPDWRTAVLLAITIWAFCRFYYFCFYVIEKYVDGKYKFAGLLDFISYLLSSRRK